MPTQKSLIIILSTPIDKTSVEENLRQIGQLGHFGFLKDKVSSYSHLLEKNIFLNEGFIRCINKEYRLGVVFYPEDINDGIQAIELNTDDRDFADDLFDNENDPYRSKPILTMIELLRSELKGYAMLAFTVDYNISPEDLLEQYKNGVVNVSGKYDLLDQYN